MVEQIIQKDVWNEFVRKNAPRSGAFLSSWEWGEFQKHLGFPVSRFAQTDASGAIQLAASCTTTRLPFGASYAYCARSPLGKGDHESFLREIGQSTHATFVRFEPVGESVPTRAVASHPIQPAQTLLLDLTQTHEAMLAGMHPKTRYNIRVAERKELSIETCDISSGGFPESVWSLFVDTKERGAFSLHTRKHYESLLTSLKEGECQAKLVVASLQDVPAAAVIVVDFAGVRTYLHGASSYTHRALMAPYALHWHLIQEAKNLGMTTYDWWGVAPENASESHPWAGFTRFKRGFGGEYLAYSGTYDLVLHPLAYGLYTAARSVNRRIRS